MVDLSDRVKTDVRLPRVLIQRLDEVAQIVGLSKNGFLTVASAAFIADLSRSFVPGKKRLDMLKDLEEEVRRIFKEAKKSL